MFHSRVVMATFKDMCEHCSLSCVHKLPGMWKKIKNVHELKLSALYCSVSPSTCSSQGRHCRAKDALRIRKHQLAEHGNTSKCKRAGTESSKDFLLALLPLSTGLNQNSPFLGGNSRAMTLKPAKDSRPPHPHSILTLCSTLNISSAPFDDGWLNLLFCDTAHSQNSQRKENKTHNISCFSLFSGS